MHYSPQIALLESITCTLMLLFYVWHSWYYDGFRSMVRLGRAAPRQGYHTTRNSFHLLMRFIYLLGLPLYIVQGVLVAYIKYSVGYLPVDMGGYPVPHTMWPEEYRRLIYSIYYLKAVGWSGETAVHLEELAFWLFLINLKRTSAPWFKSIFFRLFIVLSLAASFTTVSIVEVTKSNVALTQAVLMTFVTGLNLAVTFGFGWVFYKFPNWLKDVKKRDAPAELIIRFHECGTLNQIRMLFRLIFLAPLLVLSADGLRAKPFLNKYVWLVDLIVMSSTVAFAAQGVITLLIFCPRNLSRECGVQGGDIQGTLKSPKECGNRIKSMHFSASPPEPMGESSCSSPTTLISRPDSMPRIRNEKTVTSDPEISSPRDSMLAQRGRSSPSLKCLNNFIDEKRKREGGPVRNRQKVHEQSSLTQALTSQSYDRLSVITNIPNSDGIDPKTLSPASLCYQSSSHGCGPAFDFSTENALENHAPDQLANFPRTSHSLNASHYTRTFAYMPRASRVTHFPRYFASSERRGTADYDVERGGSGISASRQVSPNNTPAIHATAAQKDSQQANSIHPAIRNFKSPIDIQSFTTPSSLADEPWSSF